MCFIVFRHSSFGEGEPWEGLRRCSAKPRDSVGISAGEPPALLCARYMPPFRDIMMGK